MARTTLEDMMRRLVLVVACAPLPLLTGCPQQNAAPPGKVPAQATAPAVTRNNVAGAAGGGGVAPAATAAGGNGGAAGYEQARVNAAEEAARRGGGEDHA